MKQPNILFCIADDASHFGYNGFGYVKTPNIDRLAEADGGVILDNAFTTNPKCAPSRASILTGMHTWQLREGCNHFSYFPGDFEVYPDMLEANGYHVGFTGKGWGPGDYEHYGRTRNPAGPDYSDIELAPPKDSRITAVDYSANFKAFLDDNKEGKPFCFWYGCKEPHRPYNIGESWDFETKPEDIKYLPSYWPDNDLVRRDMLDYAFEINWFDRFIGEMVSELEKRNLLDDTFILITSDNGMPFPRIKGQMYEQDFHLPMVAYWKGKLHCGKELDALISFIDIGPTFLELAGVKEHNMAGKSFLPVLLDGDKGQEYVWFGREKHDVGRTNDVGYPVRCVRDKQYLYIKNYAPDRWPAGNPETKYTNCDHGPTKAQVLLAAERGHPEYLEMRFGKRPAEELYDVINDIECMHNLVNDPKYTAELARLRTALDKKLAETEDPRFLGNGDIFDSYPITQGRKIGHSWASYTAGEFEPMNSGYPFKWCGGMAAVADENEVKP